MIAIFRLLCHFFADYSGCWVPFEELKSSVSLYGDAFDDDAGSPYKQKLPREILIVGYFVAEIRAVFTNIYKYFNGIRIEEKT